MKTELTPALIIEDDPSWQGILTEILVDSGFSVDVVDHLNAALEKIHTTPYQLALVDLSLAGQNHHNQDGLIILKTIQQRAPACITILLTGYANVELAVSVIQEYGAYTCLRKETFRRADFRQILAQALLKGKAADLKTNPSNPQDDTIQHHLADFQQHTATLGSALVVEDDAGWRSLLADLLIEAGYKVYVSSSYGESLGLIKRERFKLAVADISLASSVSPMKNQDGLLLLSATRQANIPTIIVSGSADTTLINQAFLEQSVFAFLEKQSFDRQTFIQTALQPQVNTPKIANLTEREMEVLAYIARGMSNKEIASAMYITINTVKRHLKSIFEKINVNSRAGASAYAIREGLETRN